MYVQRYTEVKKIIIRRKRDMEDFLLILMILAILVAPIRMVILGFMFASPIDVIIGAVAIVSIIILVIGTFFC